jgi:hypothetical protein
MTDLNLELDHTGVAVRDLDVGQAAYQRLGFTLTPRSFHFGSRTAGGPVEKWGSGNHCAMFEDGYLEIIGITDSNLYSSTQDYLDRYEGSHIVACGSGDADASYPILNSRFKGVNPATKLQRQAAFGPNNDETRLAAFRNISIDRENFPEAKLIFIDHLTRDVLWQPHLLSHPNGAVGLAEVALCVPDADVTCGRLSKLFDRQPKNIMPGVASFALDRGNIYVMEEAGLSGWAPGVKPPCVPYVASFGVAVKDLEATRNYLAANDIATTDHPYHALWVAPEYTCGPIVSFIQA